MTRYGRDPDAILRDVITAFWHPDYDGVRFLDAYRDLWRRRGERV